MKKIESRDNKLIKKVKSLSLKKNRDKENLFIAEGLRFVNDIPDDWYVENYFMTENFIKTINKEDLEKYENKSEVCIVDENIFETMCDTENPQGILAVCRKNELSFEEVINRDIEAPFYVILEELQDPRNVGTIVRTADACGVNGIFLTKGSVDIYNPKVLRGTMGSFFHTPIIQNLTIEEIVKNMKEKNIPLYATHLKGTEYPYSMDFKGSCGFFIGNEANGLSEKSEKLCDKWIKLPMIGGAESLNASIATGVILYEVVRQRIMN